MTLTKDDAATRRLSLPQELILLNESRPSAGWISSHALSAKRSRTQPRSSCRRSTSLNFSLLLGDCEGNGSIGTRL